MLVWSSRDQPVLAAGCLLYNQVKTIKPKSTFTSFYLYKENQINKIPDILKECFSIVMRATRIVPLYILSFAVLNIWPNACAAFIATLVTVDRRNWVVVSVEKIFILDKRLAHQRATTLGINR